MSGRGKGEQGSALLMILVAVTVVGILFGGLYVSLRSSHHQAMEHELKVQAEFDAQKMMEVGLYHFYQNFDEQDDFEEKFAEADDCIEDEQDPQDKVCLTNELDDAGTYTKKLLTATGVSASNGEVKSQTRVIEVNLLAMGGDASTDRTNPDRLPVGEVPEDAKVSTGQSCFYSNERLPVRALMIGTGLDLTNGNSSKRLQIEGGIYLPEGQSIRMPEKLDHRFISVNGLIFDGANLQYDPGVTGPETAEPDVSMLGASALLDTFCANFAPFHEQVNEIANRAVRQNQPVQVYLFESNDGVVTLDATGQRKDAMYQQFNEYSGVTLREVLEGDAEKIVVIKGKLVLDEAPLNSRGYLVVYQDGASGASAIEMPSGMVWNHDGAILADTIQWPAEYRMTIRLSKGQVRQYDQSIDW